MGITQKSFIKKDKFVVSETLVFQFKSTTCVKAFPWLNDLIQ